MNNRLLLTLAAVIALLAGFWLGQSGTETTSPQADQANSIQGFILKTPRKIGVPELIRDDGELFSLSDLTGHWSLLFYGYTNCPDICPTTLNTIAAAKKKQADDFPQVVFVSVDPQRDNAQLVGDYVRYFDRDFVGVTGEEKLLQAMAAQMSVAAMAMPPEKPGDAYLVDHSANLMLLNPEGRMVAMLRPPHSVDSILHSINTVMHSEQ